MNRNDYKAKNGNTNKNNGKNKNNIKTTKKKKMKVWKKVLLVISVVGTINPNNSVHKEIEKSFIGKAMYENNILSIFFEKY